MTKYNIVLATDKNYIPYLEIVLKSLLHHNKDLSVYILNTGDITYEWQKEISPFFTRRNSSLKLVTLDPRLLSEFKESGYISTSTYLRYYIPSLFPLSDSPYWIYLDCDIVINGNITEPFDYIDFNKGAIAAVEDSYVKLLDNHPYVFERYFNAGVLYFHAHKFSEQDTNNLRIITKELRNEIIFGDQDILNTYFKHNWFCLDKKYNYQSANVVEDSKSSNIELDYVPHIFHFTGPNKPLNTNFTSLYFERIASLFKLYHQTDWEHLIKLPLSTIQLKVFAQD